MKKGVNYITTFSRIIFLYKIINKIDFIFYKNKILNT